MLSPFGTRVVGFKVTIGGVTNPASINRSYSDIKAILRANKGPERVWEEKTPDGKFKSFIIEV